MHYVLLPEPDASLVDETIERRVAILQDVVELGRKIRDDRKLGLKFPCRTLILVSCEPEFQVRACTPGMDVA